MRNLFLSFVALALATASYAQSDLDKQFPIVGQDLSNSIDAYVQKKAWTDVEVGLLNFENSDGNVSELGTFLSNELVSWVALSAAERFSVVSSNDIEKIINEKEKLAKYRPNEDKVALLNKYNIVDVVIVGTLTKFNDGYRLNLKALSTNPSSIGTVVAIKIVTLNRTADFDKMFETISIKKIVTPQSPTKEEPKAEVKTTQPEKKVESNIGKVVEAKMVGNLTRDNNMMGTVTCKLDGKIYVVHSIPGLAGNDLELDASQYDMMIIFTVDREGSGKYISHHTVGERKW